MARAGFAHERVATAAFDTEAQTVQREHAREAFGYAIKLDERHCWRDVFLVWERGAKGKHLYLGKSGVKPKREIICGDIVHTQA